MIKYIIKRIMVMVPVLGIIIILSFSLYQYSGADPVVSLMGIRGISLDNENNIHTEAEYLAVAHELNRDLPTFYFSVVPTYYPDTLYRLVIPRKKQQAKDLLAQHHNWDLVKDYMDQLSYLSTFSNNPAVGLRLRQAINQYSQGVNLQDIDRIMESIESDIAQSPTHVQQAFAAFYQTKNALTDLEKKMYFPKLLFHGRSCQFHMWFKKMTVGDFGFAMTDGRPVLSKMRKSLKWSIVLTLSGILCASLLSILIGFLTAYRKGSIFDKSTYLFLFSIFSTPLFWFATLMIVFFTSKDFGVLTNIFPSVGLFYTGDTGFIDQLFHNFKLLILPVFCLTLYRSAFLSKQMRASIIQQFSLPYYLTALSKGMSKMSALLKHVLPNALLPFITLIVGAIPQSLAGTLVIEVLFNIPGMGRLMWQSVNNNDWNTISAILIIISLVTMICFLVGDILYAYVNPKIKLQND